MGSLLLIVGKEILDGFEASNFSSRDSLDITRHAGQVEDHGLKLLFPFDPMPGEDPLFAFEVFLHAAQSGHLTVMVWSGMGADGRKSGNG